VRLRGVRSNRDGIGARIAITAGGRRQIAEMRCGGSYASDSEHVVHFGLGHLEKVDRLEVLWPSGQVDVKRDVAARREVVLVEGEE
jgi:hypothetical protein